MNRREAVRNLGLFLAGSPLVCAQQDALYTPERMPSLDELVNVFEFEPVCQAKIAKPNYDFIAGGVDNEWSLRHNRQAFDRILLRPRFLRDVSKVDLSLTLFGRKLEMPILVAPTGTQQVAHPEGELAMVRAAHQVKSVMVVSNNSSYPIEKIAAAVSDPPWFQLYPGPDMDGTHERVEKALEAGCKVIFLTVDTPYHSHRERLLRDQNLSAAMQAQRIATRRDQSQQEQTKSPYRLSLRFTGQLTWSFVDELKKWARGVPVVIKGILAAEDAKLAVEHGADGVLVSNHGGRYLEYAPATIEVLPEIVDAVGGRIPVLADSGFRRGTDILKALALGAQAVLVGRPPLWGLGAYGSAGAARVLELLQAELALAMGLSGRPNLRSIDRTLVHTG